MKETLQTTGKFKLKCLDASGNVKWETEWTKNITTNAGKAQFALLIGSVATPFTYLAVGTSNTAPSASQTALGAEITTGGLARQTATFSRVTTSVTNDTAQWTTTWSSITLPFTVQEIGYFNASSGPIMGGRGLPVQGSKSVVAGDSLVGLYQLQVS